MSTEQTPAIAIRDLEVTFTRGSRPVRAVNGVSLEVQPGEAIALLGESGSGKSVTLRSLMRLHDPRTTTIKGKIDIEGGDLLAMTRGQLNRLRGGRVAMIFQEPLLALDPVYTVGQQIVEAIRAHRAMSRGEARAEALRLLQSVRIPSPERRLDAYPHEMSGGMRQRAMIAMSLAGRPSVLLADEPTTALDATVQIQVLILLRELQRELGLAIVFVTHDIAAAVEIADRVAVMYGGAIVEEGPVRELIRHARHPYTIALLNSRREGGMIRGKRLETIGGSPPDLSQFAPGCSFAPRCPHARAVCTERMPPPIEVKGGHLVRCVLVDPALQSELAPAGS
jgi:peptide/nickel transport system ATP-binding protein